MDGPGSLTDSLAESAQVKDTDRLEKDPMGRTCVEGISQLREDLVGGGWMECAVVILGIYCVFTLVGGAPKVPGTPRGPAPAPLQLRLSQLLSPAWSPPHTAFTACGAPTWMSTSRVRLALSGGRSASSPALPPPFPRAPKGGHVLPLTEDALSLSSLPHRPHLGPLHRNRLFTPRVLVSPGLQLRAPNPAA